MNPEQVIDLNTAQCIKYTMRFGETAYYNICTNTQTVVPWGGFESVLNYGLAGLFGSLVFLLVFLTVWTLRETR